jgi:hypothetical protein
MTFQHVAEVEPSFPNRDVNIHRGVALKELYDLKSELGRLVGSCVLCHILSVSVTESDGYILV